MNLIKTLRDKKYYERMNAIAKRFALSQEWSTTLSKEVTLIIDHLHRRQE